MALAYDNTEIYDTANYSYDGIAFAGRLGIEAVLIRERNYLSDPSPDEQPAWLSDKRWWRS